MPSPSRRTLPLWAIISAAWVGPGLLAAGQTYLEIRFGGWTDGTWRNIAFQGLDWMLYGFLTPFVFALGRRFPLRRGQLVRSVSLHFVGSILLCAAWAAGGVVLRHALGLAQGGGGLAIEFAGWFFTSLPFGVSVYFAVLGVAHAVFYLTQTTLLKDQLAAARLGALRMQLHPHFLYNSLNAITVVVRDRDTQTATGMLERLGDMLHRVMRTDRPHEVPLGEEMDFVRQYLAVEQFRFSDRLKPEFQVNPAVQGAMVPDFILQPLVENALRHGVARQMAAVTVRIEARREGNELLLTVSDDGPGLGPPGAWREGVGLSNTRERLRALYGEGGTLNVAPGPAGGTVALVRIPYRESAPANG